MSIEEYDAYDGERRCGGCRFWDQINESDRGSCLRYPPQVVVLIDDDGTQTNASAYPQTGERWWCGEWADKRVRSLV